jgi:hypothetical protein
MISNWCASSAPIADFFIQHASGPDSRVLQLSRQPKGNQGKGKR